MGKKRIMVIFGTRPEAIKMVPVIKVLETFNRGGDRTASTNARSGFGDL